MNEIKYDRIGGGYNNTRTADPYLTDRLIALLQPEKDKAYFDLGCGTGNYTIALANKGLNFTGIDPSERMLEEAAHHNPSVKWLIGSAEKIPARDDAFDGAIATLTVHHWTNPQKAFTEISRVLSHDGRIVLFTATPEQMKRYWLNHYFPNMLDASIRQMPSLESVTAAAKQAGMSIETMEEYFVQDDLQDHFLYAGKNRPQIYFNEEIRSGISSFASLANKEEVIQGLSKLKNDIQSGAFESIKKQYSTGLGDYLFIVFKK